MGKQGSMGAAFLLKDAESTALDAGDGHTTVHPMPLGYIITNGRRHSLGDIYFTTMKKKVASEHLLPDVGWTAPGSRNCLQTEHLSPCPVPTQAEPSPDWRPAPQWVGMGGDPTSPLWQGSRANKVHSV